jgi:hypothetical protein
VSPLAAPRDDLTGFPSQQCSPATALYRIHRQQRAPWWFSSDGSGRFDLAPPNGTCYLAAEPLGCLVEVVRDVAVVAREFLASRRLSTLQVPQSMLLADCTARSARRFGVTGAIHSTPDYALTRGWAGALRRAGFAGIRYLVSHDPAQRRIGVAVFGSAGAVAWPVVRTAEIEEDLIDAAGREFGIRVLPGVGSGIERGQ